MNSTAIHCNTNVTTRISGNRGVTLIVAMILLVVISLTAAVTVRGSASSEQISNNARSQGLALEAAESALRYCEIGVTNQVISLGASPTATISPFHTLTIGNPPNGATPTWAITTNWDNTPVAAITVPLYTLDDPVLTATESGVTKGSNKFQGIYQRAPECIAQYAGNSTATLVIHVVARGFGPEVTNAAGRPNGSEVFLQSTLDFNP